MSEKPITAFNEEILLLAEKLGELNDRFAHIENEFAVQTSPLDAAKSAQDSAIAALRAALEGIKALNFHVLDNNLGAVSSRLDAVAGQVDVSIKEISARFDAVKASLDSVREEFNSKITAADSGRVELSKKRDDDLTEFASRFDAIKAEIGKQGDKIKTELEAAIRKFATPTSLNPRGVWDARETYQKLDVVSLNGTSWISLVNDNSEKPGKGAKNWMILAARGASAGGGGTDLSEPNLHTITTAAALDWSPFTRPVAQVTLNQVGHTFTFEGGASIARLAGRSFILFVRQDATGSRTVTFPASVIWPFGTAPTLTTTGSRTDVISFVSDGVKIYGAINNNYNPA